MADNPRIVVEADTSQAIQALARLSETVQNLQKKVSQSMAGFSKSMSNASKSMTKVGKSMQDFGEKATTRISIPLAGIGLAAIKVGSDFESMKQTMSFVYGSMENDINSFSQKLQKTTGFNANIIKQSVTGIYMQQKALGASQAEALQYTEKNVPLLISLAQLYNKDLPYAMEAFQAAVRGEMDPLENLGVQINETTLKSFAAAHGWDTNISSLSNLQRSQLISEAMFQQQGKSVNYAAQESGNFSVKISNLKDNLSKLSGTLYEQFQQPILSTINNISQLIQKFSELSPKTQSLIITFGLIATVLFPVISAVGVVMQVLGGLGHVIGFLIPLIVGAFTALNGWVIAFAVVGAAMVVFANYIMKHWSQIQAHINDVIAKIKINWSSFIQNLKTTCAGIWSIITSPFKRAWDTIKRVFSNIKQGFKNAFSFQIPHIPLPHFSIEGKLSLNPPRIPKISVNWYKKGGLATEASLIGVGEKDNEAILPLNSNVLGKLGANIASHMPEATKESTGNTTFNQTFNINAAIRSNEDIQELARRIKKLQERGERAAGSLLYD